MALEKQRIRVGKRLVIVHRPAKPGPYPPRDRSTTIKPVSPGSIASAKRLAPKLHKKLRFDGTAVLQDKVFGPDRSTIWYLFKLNAPPMEHKGISIPPPLSMNFGREEPLGKTDPPITMDTLGVWTIICGDIEIRGIDTDKKVGKQLSATITDPHKKYDELKGRRHKLEKELVAHMSSKCGGEAPEIDVGGFLFDCMGYGSDRYTHKVIGMRFKGMVERLPEILEEYKDLLVIFVNKLKEWGVEVEIVPPKR